jgi:perosamine synthetase
MEIPPLKVVFDSQEIELIQSRIWEVLSTGMLAQGKYVAEFERKWSEYIGVKHAVAVNSGSSAIEIPMRILGVQSREVLVPDNTFAATAFAVLLSGGQVRFVDTDAATFSVTLEDLKAARTKRTAGVILVHIGGIVTPEIGEIREWCLESGLWLFEDCAHAHGSQCDGKFAGSFGEAGAYSFFATKVMTTGEGGMVITNDDRIAEQARLIRNHGKPEPWVSRHTEIGSNYRMSEINAILGLSQLERLDELIAWRSKIADLYTDWLKEVPEIAPVLPASRSSWYKYIARLPRGLDRQILKSRMKQRGVSLSGEVYEIPLHRQPIFEAVSDGQFPRAEEICSTHICLPLYYGMTPDEARFVVDALHESLADP